MVIKYFISTLLSLNITESVQSQPRNCKTENISFKFNALTDRQVVIVVYLQKAGQLYIVYDTGQMDGKSKLHLRQGLGLFSSVQPTKPHMQLESWVEC